MTARLNTTSRKTRTARLSLGAIGLSLCMMLLADPALSAPPGPDGNRGHLNRLLHDPALIDHLGLTGEQAATAQKISNDVIENHRAAFDKALTSDNKAERVPLVARVFVSVNAETFDRLARVIDVHQRQRLEQIEIQTFGIRAFSRPAVIDHLGLTPSQRNELRSLGNRTGEQLSGLHRSSTLSAAEKSDSARRIRHDALREARQRLNAGQWVKWELLTGAEFAP